MLNNLFVFPRRESESKRRPYKKTVRKKRVKFAVAFFLFIGLIAGGLVLGLYSPKNFKSNKRHTAFVPHVVIPTKILVPTFTPTPTPIPTPTSVPLVGYCLNVPILYYHHIQPQSLAIEKKQTALSVDNTEFDSQMAYLSSQGFTTLTAKTLVEALKNHTGVPLKSILVTLDDGYKDAYTNAYPIFQKYHITANLLIATGLLGGPDYMSWGEVEEMARSGLIYIVDHTVSHYSVNYGSLDKIKYEVEAAKQQLEEHTGQTISIFAYPYGGFNDLSISVLKQDGFTGAFSTIPGFWQCDSFIMTLHRNRIGNSSLSFYGL